MKVEIKNQYLLKMKQMEMMAMNLFERGRIRGYDVSNRYTPESWEMSVAVAFLPKDGEKFDRSAVWRASSGGLFDGGLERMLIDEVNRMNSETKKEETKWTI